MSRFGIGSFQKVAQELFGSLVVCSKLPKLGVGARARCNLGKIYWQGTGRQNLCQIVLFCMMVSNCPRCQIVLGVKLSSLPSWCQIVLLAIMVSNCPKCQMVLGVKLSAVSNCPRINFQYQNEKRVVGAQQELRFQDIFQTLVLLLYHGIQDSTIDPFKLWDDPRTI